MARNLKKNKPEWIAIAVLACITVAAVSCMVMILLLRQPAEPTLLTPDRAPAPEEGALRMDDDAVALPSEQTGGSVSLAYAKEVDITLTDEKAQLYFANPGKSTQDLVLQIVVQDTLLAQSGRLTPGYCLTELSLVDGAASMLAPGSYDGKFRVLYYDRLHGDRAIVNTEIPIEITVEE